MSSRKVLRWIAIASIPFAVYHALFSVYLLIYFFIGVLREGFSEFGKFQTFSNLSGLCFNIVYSLLLLAVAPVLLIVAKYDKN